MSAGFRGDDVKVIDGSVYVGGDAEVSLQASKEMLATDGSSKEQYRTTNLVSTPVAKICIEGENLAQDATGDFSAGLDLAIQNYNDLSLAFAMARTPAVGCTYTIRMFIDPGTVTSHAGFPAGGHPFTSITLGEFLIAYNRDVIEHVITHEIGHTIGLRHSDYFDPNISCGAAKRVDGDEGAGSILIPGTPSGATVGGSIMNSCFRDQGETGEFRSSDVVALRALYPAPQPPPPPPPPPAPPPLVLYQHLDDEKLDLNGDGRADVCGRRSDGILCAVNAGGNFNAATVWTADFGNAGGWSLGQRYYSTISFPDVNGDGRADVCGRSADGIVCGRNVGGHFEHFTNWSAAFSDPAGWGTGPEYYSTIEFPDVNGDGKADVCGRSADGVLCALSNGASFGGVTFVAPAFSNAGGWSAGPEYYSTIQYPDVNGDGKADVCGRSGDGVLCALSTGSNFGGISFVAPAFSNAGGWSVGPEYYSTIKYVDVNGDGKADVCGRSGDGVLCALSTGSNFGGISFVAPAFSNAGGWSTAPEYYSTIKYADVNGDGKADVCGRSADGVLCALSTGSNFAGISFVASMFGNAGGWSVGPEYYSTIKYADVNGDGKADVCGRSGDGVLCALSTGTNFGGFSFVAPEFSNAGGWNTGPEFYSTIRLP